MARMDDQRIGQALRAVRVKKRLRQSDVALLAGVGRTAVGQLERGHAASQRLDHLRAVAAALDISVDISVRWHGADLDRLLSTGHAAMHEIVGALLNTITGWGHQAEVSFSIYGERGVIDILAWHAPTRSLLIVELKTTLGDPQAVVATMDRRIRLGKRIAAERGWDPLTVSSWVLIADGPTNRRHVTRHAVLLRGRFPAQGPSMRAWLREPSGTIHGLSFLSDARHGDRIGPTVTPRRVRRRALERGSAAGARGEAPSARQRIT